MVQVRSRCIPALEKQQNVQQSTLMKLWVGQPTTALGCSCPITAGSLGAGRLGPLLHTPTSGSRPPQEPLRNTATSTANGARRRLGHGCTAGVGGKPTWQDLKPNQKYKRFGGSIIPSESSYSDNDTKLEEPHQCSKTYFINMLLST